MKNLKLNEMKEKRLYFILLVMGLMIAATINACSQSFFAHKNHPDTHEITPIGHKKKLTVYHKRSLLYKIRRDISHSRKRKNFKKAKTTA